MPCLATFGLICWFLSLLLLKSFGLPFFFFKVHLFFCSCSSCPLSTLWGLIANVGRSRVIPGWKMLPGYCFNPTKTMNQCLLVSLAPHECRSRKSTQPGKALGMLTNVLLNQTEGPKPLKMFPLPLSLPLSLKALKGELVGAAVSAFLSLLHLLCFHFLE